MIEHIGMAGPDGRLDVGFIGLGDMGSAIAERIVDKGFPLAVYDLRAAAAAQLTARGVSSAASPSALAAACDLVFVCVVDDRQVLALVQDHLASSLREGAVLVILSSVRPETMHEVQALLPRNAHGNAAVSLLDSPVSGSRPAVAAGTLTLMIGGDASAIERIRPVLEAFSARIFLTGPLGSGQAMKIANNLMLHMNHLVALEAVRFARAQGISEKALMEVVNASSGRSWVTETWGLIDGMFRDHPQAGTTGIYDMMVKEMWNAVLLSRSTGTWLPLTGLGVQIGRAFHIERERDLAIGPDHPLD
jgi:3-hydroxyisobutyrate dehydrogenase